MTVRCLVGFLLTVGLSGCASAPKLEMAKVDQDLNQALARADESAQKAQSAHELNQSRLAQLAKTGNEEDVKHRESLQVQMAKVDHQLEVARLARKRMLAAKGEATSITYGHTELTKSDAQYEPLQREMKEFASADQDQAEALRLANREIQNLQEAIEQNHLFAEIDVLDFQHQVQTTINESQSLVIKMESDLNRDKMFLEQHSDSPQHDTLADSFAGLKAKAEEFTSKAQHLAQVSREMNIQTADSSKVNSTEHSWHRASAVLEDFKHTVMALKQLQAEFQKGQEIFVARDKASAQ